MENRLGIFILFMGFSLSLMAQNDDISITYHQAPDVVKDTFQLMQIDKILQKTAVGGMLTFEAGTYVCAIGLSPDISYHFNKWVAVGVGGTYSFLYYNYYKESYHTFGARTFVEGHFFNYIGLHAAYHAINCTDFNSPLMERIWSNNISIGGGYYRRMGRVSTYLFLLYNISDRQDLFSNLYFRAGFNVFLKK